MSILRKRTLAGEEGRSFLGQSSIWLVSSLNLSYKVFSLKSSRSSFMAPVNFLCITMVDCIIHEAPCKTDTEPLLQRLWCISTWHPQLEAKLCVDAQVAHCEAGPVCHWSLPQKGPPRLECASSLFSTARTVLSTEGGALSTASTHECTSNPAVFLAWSQGCMPTGIHSLPETQAILPSLADTFFLL